MATARAVPDHLRIICICVSPLVARISSPIHYPNILLGRKCDATEVGHNGELTRVSTPSLRLEKSLLS